MKKRQEMLGLEKAEDDAIAKLGEEFFSYEIPSIVFHEAVESRARRHQVPRGFH